MSDLKEAGNLLRRAEMDLKAVQGMGDAAVFTIPNCAARPPARPGGDVPHRRSRPAGPSPICAGATRPLGKVVYCPPQPRIPRFAPCLEITFRPRAPRA